MSQILIYCSKEDFQSALERNLQNYNYTYETTRKLDSVVEQTVKTRPDVLILCLNGETDGCDDTVAAIRRESPETKIIYATNHPGKNDVKSLEYGIFYYAGNASADEIVLAVKAALESAKEKISKEVIKCQLKEKR